MEWRLNEWFRSQDFYDMSRRFVINQITFSTYPSKNQSQAIHYPLSILFLFNNEEPSSIETLQTNVWGYKKNLETHTVETHIYRLRKKILEKFGDDKFITFENNGYQIK